MSNHDSQGALSCKCCRVSDAPIIEMPCCGNKGRTILGLIRWDQHERKLKCQLCAQELIPITWKDRTE